MDGVVDIWIPDQFIEGGIAGIDRGGGVFARPLDGRDRAGGQFGGTESDRGVCDLRGVFERIGQLQGDIAGGVACAGADDPDAAGTVGGAAHGQRVEQKVVTGHNRELGGTIDLNGGCIKVAGRAARCIIAAGDRRGRPFADAIDQCAVTGGGCRGGIAQIAGVSRGRTVCDGLRKLVIEVLLDQARGIGGIRQRLVFVGHSRRHHKNARDGGEHHERDDGGDHDLDQRETAVSTVAANRGFGAGGVHGERRRTDRVWVTDRP